MIHIYCHIRVSTIDLPSEGASGGCVCVGWGRWGVVSMLGMWVPAPETDTSSQITGAVDRTVRY